MRQRDGEILKRCAGMHAAARKAWGRRFLGRRSTPNWIAAGTEVTGYRDYVTGDDFRYVDWNRAARLDELMSKQFHGGGPQRVELLLDTTASMGVGAPTKLALAKELARAWGYLALAEHWSVRLIGCGGPRPSVSQWFRGLPAAPAWLRAVERLGRPSGKGGLMAAARAVLRDRHAGQVVIVMSDLMQPEGFQSGLEALQGGRRELHAVQVFAAEDAAPPWDGALRLHDVESGEQMSVELDEDDAANYRDVFAEFMRSIRRHCARHGVGLSQFRSDMPVQQCVERLLRTASLPAAVIATAAVTATVPANATDTGAAIAAVAG